MVADRHIVVPARHRLDVAEIGAGEAQAHLTAARVEDVPEVSRAAQPTVYHLFGRELSMGYIFCNGGNAAHFLVDLFGACRHSLVPERNTLFSHIDAVRPGFHSYVCVESKRFKPF